MQRESLPFCKVLPSLAAPDMASAATRPEADGRTAGEHELDDMADQTPGLPVEEDVMQLARLGEIAAMQKLFDSGKADATYTDDQGITPLHVRSLRGPPRSAHTHTERS